MAKQKSDFNYKDLTFTYQDIKNYFGEGKIEIKERAFITLRDLYLGMEVLGFNRHLYLEYTVFEDGIKMNFQKRLKDQPSDNILALLDECFNIRMVEELQKASDEHTMENGVMFNMMLTELHVKKHYQTWKKETLEEWFNKPLYMNDANAINRHNKVVPLNWETLHRFGGQGKMHALTVELSVPLQNGTINFPLYLRNWEYLYHNLESLTTLARNMLLNSTTVKVNIVP